MKITVKDMTCNHCVAKIQKALLMEKIMAKIDLSSHTVDVKDIDLDKAMVAIKEAGYTPTK